MKNILVLLILLHLGFEAKSQFNLFCKIGINQANLYAESLEQKSVIGYQIGLTSNIDLNERFVFQPEILISQKGGELRTEKLTSSDYFEELKLKRTYIDFPILLKYKILKLNKINFHVNTGINFGFGFFSNMEMHVLDMNSSGKGPEFNNAFCFGLIGGFGVDLFNVSALEFRYEYGLTNVMGFPNEPYTNRVFSLAVALRCKKRLKNN